KRLYAVLADPSEPRRAHWLRSDDGGGTWSTLEAVEPPERCLGFEYAYAVLLLQPDAIDRDRVYRADMRREDGWLRGDALQVSPTAGLIWLDATRTGGWPAILWTNAGSPGPERWLTIASDRPRSTAKVPPPPAYSGQTMLLRVAGDGSPWTVALALAGVTPADVGGPDFQVGGMAVDPREP